tara:strand:+ start:199 stop:429 length:231 start_codon:yes stop_codon:yes gene_type:complete
MQHTIEELIRRLDTMKDKAILLHRVRNEFAEISYKQYDREACQHILDDIQTMALLIAKDRDGTEILTEMDNWKEKG